MGKHFLCQPMPRDRPSRTIRTPWLLARCSVRPRPPPSLCSPYRRGGLADAPSKTLSTSRARHAFSFLHRPPSYHTNTMASGEVLRATSPSAILKLTLQTRRSRRCTMMSERSIAGYDDQQRDHTTPGIGPQCEDDCLVQRPKNCPCQKRVRTRRQEHCTV